MPSDDETTRTATDVDTTEVSPPSPSLERLGSGSTLGRYEIGDIVGAGGMGVVYRARDPELKRDVAIKVVAASPGRSRERLLTEARAMAKLDHPSLVPVFDVGSVGDGVYIVMPFLAGGTLHDWIHAQPRPWREVLDRFIRAGRGLVAAHAAGIIHGDFTPRNVLLDGDNVLVAMEPDEAQGQAVDARADVYGFSISLWEALYGHRPPAPGTREHVSDPSNAASAVPVGTRGLPSWLRAAVAKGFSASPEERWPTIEAMLAHIERRRKRPRRFAIAAAAVAMAGIVAAIPILLRHDERAVVCPPPDAQLAGIWDSSIRTRIEQTLSVTDSGKSPATASEVVAAIDDRVTAWRAMHIEACRATHVERKQTAEIHDRRMLCLERRLALLRTLTSTLAETQDRSLGDRATALLASLPAIQDCADTKRLMAVSAPPADAGLRAEIQELDNELDAITALKWRGEHVEQLRRAQAAVENARTLKHAPILARALETLAKAEGDNGQHSPATSRELARVASEAGLDELAATAWVNQLMDLTQHRIDYDEARALEAAVRAAIVRAGSPPKLLFRELYFGAIRAYNSAEYEVARQRLIGALVLAPTAEVRAEIALNLAAITKVIDGPSAALPAAETAVTTYEALFGNQSAFMAEPLMLLAQLLYEAGNLERAREVGLRTLGIQEKAIAPDSPDLAITLNTLGSIEAKLERPDDAFAYLERAVHIFEKAGDVQRHGLALRSLAAIVAKREGLAKARPLYRRGLSQLERGNGKDWSVYARVELDFAEALVDGGACHEIEPLLAHAAMVLAKSDASFIGIAHWLRARCHLASRRVGDAIAELERADERCRAGDCGVRDSVRWTLGKLLVERRRDRERGLALVREARAGWTDRGLGEKVAEVDAWLAKYGGK